MSFSTMGVFNMTLPNEGPITLPELADMTAKTEHEFDMSQAIEQGIVSFISGAWIDNSLNAQALNIDCQASGQNIIFPASKQGFMQLLLPNPPVVNLSQAAPGGVVRFIFVNFPVFPYIIGN